MCADIVLIHVIWYWYWYECECCRWGEEIARQQWYNNGKVIASITVIDVKQCTHSTQRFTGNRKAAVDSRRAHPSHAHTVNGSDGSRRDIFPYIFFTPALLTRSTASTAWQRRENFYADELTPINTHSPKSLYGNNGGNDKHFARSITGDIR